MNARVRNDPEWICRFVQKVSAWWPFPKKLTCLLGAWGDVTYLCNMYLYRYDTDMYISWYLFLFYPFLYVIFLPRNDVGYFPTCRVNLNGRTWGHYAQTGRWLAQQRRSTCSLAPEKHGTFGQPCNVKGLRIPSYISSCENQFQQKNKKSHSWCLFSEML